MSVTVRLHHRLKAFSARHEWFAGLAIVMGVGTLGGVIWGVAMFNGPLSAWLQRDPFVHHLLLGAGILAAVVLAYWWLCLGCSNCEEDATCPARPRGLRLKSFPGALRVFDSLGGNPKRRHAPYRNVFR